MASVSTACATCRRTLPPEGPALRCTVASCNSGRQKLRFCSERCWSAHVPTARHRKAAFVIEGGGIEGDEKPGAG
jgi:hypothetical protein